MGFRNFTTYLSKNSAAFGSVSDHITNKDFLFWFSGFTDAEGNFLVTIDRKYVKLRFKISLHIFSSLIEWFIKLLSCIFKYYIKELNTPKVPLKFMRHPTLRLSKFKINSGVRYYSTLSNNRIEEETGDIQDKSPIKLNPHWVSGFTDAEGSFMIQVLKQAPLAQEKQVEVFHLPLVFIYILKI